MAKAFPHVTGGRRINRANIVAVLLAALCLFDSSAAWAAERVALVIGNKDYKYIDPLHNTLKDADEIGKRLKLFHFDVVYVPNGSRREMINKIDIFLGKISSDSEVVVYYSGHGVQVRGENYLIPIDLWAENENHIISDGIALTDLLNRVAALKARFSLAIIDACRNNPFKTAGKSAMGARGLRTEAVSGMMIMYAAGANQEALDRLSPSDRNPNGLFTRELLKALDQPGLEIREILEIVGKNVQEAAAQVGRVQVPALYQQAYGKFYFSRKPEPAPPVAPEPSLLSSLWGGGASPPRRDEPQVPGVGKQVQDCPRCPKLTIAPGGSFTMGSPGGEQDRDEDEGPLREVRVRPFAVGVFETTFDEWAACVAGGGCRGNPAPNDLSWGKGPNPVINVSWRDAREYVAWLSATTGKKYRLLTEAEWEYAARAGSKGEFAFGNTIAPSQANYNARFVYLAGTRGKSAGRPVRVGSFPANAFGLHDMHGNVWEWVEDCYRDSYTGAPIDGSAVGGGGCERVLRGGGWDGKPHLLRSASRLKQTEDYRSGFAGFRVARDNP